MVLPFRRPLLSRLESEREAARGTQGERVPEENILQENLDILAVVPDGVPAAGAARQWYIAQSLSKVVKLLLPVPIVVALVFVLLLLLLWESRR